MGSWISLDIFWLLRKVGHPSEHPLWRTRYHSSLSAMEIFPFSYGNSSLLCSFHHHSCFSCSSWQLWLHLMLLWLQLQACHHCPLVRWCWRGRGCTSIDPSKEGALCMPNAVATINTVTCLFFSQKVNAKKIVLGQQLKKEVLNWFKNQFRRSTFFGTKIWRGQQNILTTISRGQHFWDKHFWDTNHKCPGVKKVWGKSFRGCRKRTECVHYGKARTPFGVCDILFCYWILCPPRTTFYTRRADITHFSAHCACNTLLVLLLW